MKTIIYLKFIFTSFVMLLFFSNLQAQGNGEKRFWEEVVSDTSKRINTNCKFTALNYKAEDSVNYFQFIDTLKYDLTWPSYKDFVYTIENKEYKFPSPYIEEITLVDYNIGMVSLFTVPKEFPNKWLWENYQRRSRPSIMQTVVQLWFANLNQLIEAYDIYAFRVNNKDLEKTIEGGAKIDTSYYIKNNSTLYLSKYVNGKWLIIGNFFIPDGDIVSPKSIGFRFVQECGLVRIREYMAKQNK